jgi:hypothetical protein
MRLFRYWLGRTLIHAGLRAFPPGRVRTEVTELLNEWGRQVGRELARHNP